MKRLGYGLTRREAVILSWGGLRGALGLTLALMVSYTLNIPEEIRSQILLMTAGIVTLTLTVNATTIRWLLTKLGLTEIPAEEAFIEYSIKRRVADSAENYYNKLKNREALAGADWEELKSFLPQIGQEPDISGCSRERLLKTLRMKIYSTEYQLIRQLYADGTISKVTYRKLINSQEYDFSRIQGRFDTRISLTSANADEVIQRRLLEKEEEPQQMLCEVYQKENHIIKSLFNFGDNSQFKSNYKNNSNTPAAPTKPSSSPTVQNMKSVSCSGTNLSFVCVPFKKPFPFSPPEPIAISL